MICYNRLTEDTLNVIVELGGLQRDYLPSKMNSERDKIVEKALEAIKAGHRVYATSLLKYLLKTDPDDIKTRKLLFQVLQDPLSSSSSHKNKIKSYFLKLKADNLLRRGQVRQALEQYQQAFELNPLNINILVAITEILITHNPSAVELLETIEIEHVQDINLLKKIARIYLNAKNLPLAKQALKRILIINPNELESQKMLKNLEALGVLEKEFKPT